MGNEGECSQCLPPASFGFGIIVGLLSGMLGIGGGVVLVPGLILLFGFSQIEAQGTSLAVLSVPVVLFAALVYYQAGFSACLSSPALRPAW